MPSEEPHLEPDESPRRGGQFSLLTLLLLPVAVAVPCALVFTTSPMVVVPAAIACGLILPGVLTTVIVYGSDAKRAFSIGAIFPAGAWAIGATLAFFAIAADSWNTWPEVSEDDALIVRWMFGAAWLIVFAAGGLCVGARWLVGRNRSDRDRPR